MSKYRSAGLPMPLPVIDRMRRPHAGTQECGPGSGVRARDGKLHSPISLQLQLPCGGAGRCGDGTGQPIAHDRLAARRGGLDPQFNGRLVPEAAHRAGEPDLVVDPVEPKGLAGETRREAPAVAPGAGIGPPFIPCLS